jgi:hypothetical protein
LSRKIASIPKRLESPRSSSRRTRARARELSLGSILRQVMGAVLPPDNLNGRFSPCYTSS